MLSLIALTFVTSSLDDYRFQRQVNDWTISAKHGQCMMSRKVRHKNEVGTFAIVWEPALPPVRGTGERNRKTSIRFDGLSLRSSIKNADDWTYKLTFGDMKDGADTRYSTNRLIFKSNTSTWFERTYDHDRPPERFRFYGDDPTVSILHNEKPILTFDIGPLTAVTPVFNECNSGLVAKRDAAQAIVAKQVAEERAREAEVAEKKDEKERKAMKCEEDDELCWWVKSGM